MNEKGVLICELCTVLQIFGIILNIPSEPACGCDGKEQLHERERGRDLEKNPSLKGTRPYGRHRIRPLKCTSRYGLLKCNS